jgi:hypothetical protein
VLLSIYCENNFILLVLFVFIIISEERELYLNLMAAFLGIHVLVLKVSHRGGGIKCHPWVSEMSSAAKTVCGYLG